MGEKWSFAVPVIQIIGVMAAVNQSGFNWTAFYRALDDTKPIAVANAVLLVFGLGLGLPLLLSDGVAGFAAGLAVAEAIAGLGRPSSLPRLFPAGGVLVPVARGMAPTLRAAVSVLALGAAG